MLCHAVPYDMIWHGVHCGFILIINSENIGSTLRRSNFLSFILAKLLFVYTIIAILIKELFLSINIVIWLLSFRVVAESRVRVVLLKVQEFAQRIQRCRCRSSSEYLTFLLWNWRSLDLVRRISIFTVVNFWVREF